MKTKSVLLSILALFYLQRNIWFAYVFVSMYTVYALWLLRMKYI